MHPLPWPYTCFPVPCAHPCAVASSLFPPFFSIPDISFAFSLSFRKRLNSKCVFLLICYTIHSFTLFEHFLEASPILGSGNMTFIKWDEVSTLTEFSPNKWKQNKSTQEFQRVVNALRIIKRSDVAESECMCRSVISLGVQGKLFLSGWHLISNWISRRSQRFRGRELSK